ncbi:hypothetical protein D3C86_1047720 [compost metagenome]
MQRTQVLAVVRQRLQRFAQDAGKITDTVQIALKMRGRRFRPLAAGRRDRDQVTGEVAAVHRRNVAGSKRLQRVRMVPVVEMAAMFLHLLDGLDRVLDPLQSIGKADPAELARRNDGEQVDADIGGRRTRCDDRLRRFLEVIRRQVVFLRRHEGLVITPCAARDLAKLEGDVFRNEQPVFGFSRLADIPGNGRRQNPEKREGNADQEGIVTRQRREQQAEHRHYGRMPHLSIIIDDAALRARLHAGGGTPFQHQLVADEQAVKRAGNRVGHHAGGIGDEDDAQRHLCVGRADFRPDGVKMRLRHDIGGAGHEAGEQGKRGGYEQREDQQNLPDQRAQWVHEIPAEDRSEEPGDRRQRATQVIDHLPAADRGNATGTIEDKGQKLPVATRPAMLARHFNLVTGREILDQLHVGHQRAAREGAFEQIVAENGVFLDPALQRRLKGIHVVKALAGEGALGRQVLIDVGNGEDVRIDTAVDREDPLENGCVLAGGERGRYARLQQTVAFDNPSGHRVDHRTIDRVVHLAHELGHRIAHQARIGIQCHDVFHALRHDIGAAQERCILVAAQQHVQLMQLAALALPAHPAAFSRIVDAAAV